MQMIVRGFFALPMNVPPAVTHTSPDLLSPRKLDNYFHVRPSQQNFLSFIPTSDGIPLFPDPLRLLK